MQELFPLNFESTVVQSRYMPYLITSQCHIYASMNPVNIGSDNDLLPIRRQAII